MFNRWTVWVMSILVVAAQILCADAMAQDAGVEFGAEDDLTVLGREGTSDDADMEVKGYSVFGNSGSNAVVVTQGVGSVFIEGSIEVGSNLYVTGTIQRFSF